MRRKDRERDKAFALDVIDNAPYCTIGIATDSHVYTVPLSIVRDGDHLYFHSAADGHKVDMLRSCLRASLTAVSDCIVDQDDYTVHYRSAHADCDVHEVSDEEEKIKALKLIIRHFASDNEKIDPDRYIQHLIDETLIWRLDIINIAGKENR